MIASILLILFVSRFAQVRASQAMPRDKVMSMGTTFGKFSKTKKFRLHVTCLDYVAQHAQYKVRADAHTCT